MAAGSTYTPIATTTLGSAQASITFSSLGSYTDIIVEFVGTSDTGGSRAVYLQFNSDTGTNYSQTYINGNGTSAVSGRGTNTNQIGEILSMEPTNPSFATIHIQSYGNSTINKSILARGTSQNQTSAAVGLWRSTAAITSLRLFPSGGNFNTGTIATIYGIAAA